MTIAIADAFLEHMDKINDPSCDEKLKTLFVKKLKQYGRNFDSSYGDRFRQWLRAESSEPYNSFGNGSAMRVSPAAWVTDDLERVRTLAKLSAEVTHNHPEGIKGAEAIAGSVFLARTGASKEEIKSFVEKEFGYDLNRKTDDIRETYEFDETCQGSVPEAIICFLESKDFEDAIRTAISIGGDSDTIAAMTGSITEAYYKNLSETELYKTIIEGKLPRILYNVTGYFQRFFMTPRLK